MTRSKHSKDFKKGAVRVVIRNNQKTNQVVFCGQYYCVDI
jgi:hypothetical protein